MRRRKNGEIKSCVEDGGDVLSLLLQRQDVFDDEDIVDELVDF